jgi:hypothetical protein
LIYNKADELDHAIEMAELLKKKYDKSDLAEQNDFLLAELLRAHRRLRDAAAKLYNDYYETYKKDTKDKESKAADALFNSGVYYQGLGDSKRPSRSSSSLHQGVRTSADAADVYWRICEIQESRKELEEGGRVLRQVRQGVQEGLARPRCSSHATASPGPRSS